MSPKIATAPQPETSLPSLDTVLPVSRREVYWRPKYLADSDFLPHLPVLFWLMGDLRPQSVVTLGGGPGASAVAHLALCQAVEKLGLDADCTGIGTWPGSGPGSGPGADGADAPPEDIAQYAETQYGEFSRLVTAPEAGGPALFDAGSIDLLVVDRTLDAGLVSGLADWADRLSEEGCLVLRGTETARRDPACAKALDALREGRPALRLSQGDGLWVLAAGDALPPRLARMVELEGDRALLRAMQHVFQRLGAACANEWEARRAARAEGEMRSEVDRLRPEIARLSAAEGGLTEELSQLRRAFDARGADLDRLKEDAAATERDRDARIAALEAELARQARALDTATDDLADLRAVREAEAARHENALEAARAGAAARDAKLAEARDAARAAEAEGEARVAALEAEIAGLRDASPAQTEALSKLTALLAEGEEREAELARQLSERPEAAADPEETAALERELAELRARAERDRAALEEARSATAALEEDARRAAADRADAMRTLADMRATLEEAQAAAGAPGEVAALGEEIAELRAQAERDRAALEEDARRAAADRADAMRTIAELREALAAAGGGRGTEERAALDLALGEATQARERLEAEADELREAVSRQARELAELTQLAGDGGAPRAAELAERAAGELARSEREARDLAEALRATREELQRTKRDLARMTGRKEHLEARIRAELNG